MTNERGRPTHWTFTDVLAAVDHWERRFQSLPTSYDLSATWAKRRGAWAREQLTRNEYPSPTTINRLFGAFGNMGLALNRVRTMWHALHRDADDQPSSLFLRGVTDPQVDLATETALWNEWLTVAPRPLPDDPREDFYTWLLAVGRARAPYLHTSPAGMSEDDAGWYAKELLPRRKAGAQPNVPWLFDPQQYHRCGYERNPLRFCPESEVVPDWHLDDQYRSLYPVSDRRSFVSFDALRSPKRLSRHELDLVIAEMEDPSVSADVFEARVNERYDVYKTWGFDADPYGCLPDDRAMFALFEETDRARARKHAAREKAQAQRAAANASRQIDDCDALIETVRQAFRHDDEATPVFTDGRTLTVVLLIDSDSPIQLFRAHPTATHDEMLDAHTAIWRSANVAGAALDAAPRLARIDVLLLYAALERRTLTPYLHGSFWRDRLARMTTLDLRGWPLELFGESNIVVTITRDLMLAPITVLRPHVADLMIPWALLTGCAPRAQGTPEAARASHESALVEQWDPPWFIPVPDAAQRHLNLHCLTRRPLLRPRDPPAARSPSCA